jgi:preprotein translocase subunit SecE
LNTARRGRISRLATGGKDHSMAKTNPFQFLQQTRAEVAKVVWPSRREVGLTTAMVAVMATLTAIFFFLVDLTIRTGLQAVLNYFG